jgi:NADPH-dependent 2,4-dienoyl-CoA reductase/sulfur reductase-like enzyme
MSRPRVVIIGAGFGGLSAARALRRAEADVLVVDRHNYHLFQPLLYQVASGLLDPAEIAHPVRSILRGHRRRGCWSILPFVATARAAHRVTPRPMLNQTTVASLAKNCWMVNTANGSLFAAVR